MLWSTLSSPLDSARNNAARIGVAGERAAATFMRRKGYRILARNFQSPFAEVDLVCAKRELVVLAEVKTRTVSFPARDPDQAYAASAQPERDMPERDMPERVTTDRVIPDRAAVVLPATRPAIARADPRSWPQSPDAPVHEYQWKRIARAALHLLERAGTPHRPIRLDMLAVLLDEKGITRDIRHVEDAYPVRRLAAVSQRS